MRWSLGLVAVGVALGATWISAAQASGARQIPSPLPEHPGNIFLEGESVEVAAPAAFHRWQLLDYEKKIVVQGDNAGDRIALGKLPIGYYELHRADGIERVTLAVLARLQQPTPEDSPIGIDVAMAWFYKDEAKQRAAANLCQLAGINWVRDRLSWPAMEPKAGEFAGHNIYDDTARIQTEAGLKVLQVNHIAPPWEKDAKRFPSDLRDAYRFYREMSKRWKGRVLAFEPWNEADIKPFGGHTGSEIASLQKASYFGLKDGNPDVIACENVFARANPKILQDFRENQVGAYFDTYNLHHYVGLKRYPEVYDYHRAVSSGKPMWVTECNIPVKWSGDEKKHEPSDEDLRVQAERVAKIYAAALHEGAANVFYFMLPHYVEGQTQYGVLHEDLTPRPAFAAVAAAGRFLAHAKPVGKAKWGDSGVAYFFSSGSATGEEHRVAVAWSSLQPIELPARAGVFDHLGRAVPADKPISLGNAPMYFTDMPAGDSAKVPPPPVTKPTEPSEPCRIVLQTAVAPENAILEESAYKIDSKRGSEMSLFVYNFGMQPANVKLTAQAPEGWSVELPVAVALQPNERKAVMLRIKPGEWRSSGERVRITANAAAMGEAVLSFRIVQAK